LQLKLLLGNDNQAIINRLRELSLSRLPKKIEDPDNETLQKTKELRDVIYKTPGVCSDGKRYTATVLSKLTGLNLLEPNSTPSIKPYCIVVPLKGQRATGYTVRRPYLCPLEKSDYAIDSEGTTNADNQMPDVGSVNVRFATEEEINQFYDEASQPKNIDAFIESLFEFIEQND
jgi:hypothetical protein